MFRFLLIVGVFLFSAGCHLLSGGEKEVQVIPVEQKVNAEPVKKLPELSLDDLKGELRVRSFQFVEKPEASSSKSPQVQVMLENITSQSNLSFELATDFLGSDGQLVERTDWVAFEMTPGEIYQYIASTSSSYAREGKIRLRRIEALRKEETKSTSE